MENELRTEYFEWLYNLVCARRYSTHISYRKLLNQLHDIEFTYTIRRDRNRAADGEDLRYRFALFIEQDIPLDEILDMLECPCSVLEMMIALAIRCEETIMDDPLMGDRTTHWFWEMIVNLGLGSMTDDFYDEDFVYEVIDRLLRRDYEPDGRGGLFTIRHCDIDMRTVEIWHQLCRYLDSIT